MIQPSWDNCKDCIHNIVVHKDYKRKTNYCKAGQEGIYGYWLKDYRHDCPYKKIERE